MADQHVVKYTILHGNKDQDQNKAEKAREGKVIRCRRKPSKSEGVVREAFSKRARDLNNGRSREEHSKQREELMSRP